MEIYYKGVIVIFTYQMVGVADQNGRTYASKYGTYNKKGCFSLSELAKNLSKEELLERLVHEDCWSLKIEEKEMTKEEIEKALGYKIKIKDDKKWKINPNTKGNLEYNGKKFNDIPYGLLADDDIWSLIFK